MNNLYMLPMMLAILIAVYLMATTKANQKKMVDRPFTSDTANDLYALSYSAPFVWFVNPDEEDKRVKEIKKLIVDAGMSNRLNYRSYIVVQTGILMISIVVFFILSLFINNLDTIIKLLFNIDMSHLMADEAGINKVKIYMGMILLLPTLAPKYWLKKKADNSKFFFSKDLPILQLFVILMLRSKRPVAEVLYVLSKTNTRYRHIFETGYRIYVRDKESGLKYIQECFEGTKFEETVVVISEYNDYSKVESLNVLENNMRELTEYTNNLKRKKDLSSLIFSQGSLAVPFLSLMLLALVPVAMFGSSVLDGVSKM